MCSKLLPVRSTWYQSSNHNGSNNTNHHNNKYPNDNCNNNFIYNTFNNSSSFRWVAVSRLSQRVVQRQLLRRVEQQRRMHLRQRGLLQPSRQCEHRLLLLKHLAQPPWDEILHLTSYMYRTPHTPIWYPTPSKYYTLFVARNSQ